jgi:hypothetical protein
VIDKGSIEQHTPSRREFLIPRFPDLLRMIATSDGFTEIVAPAAETKAASAPSESAPVAK